MTLSLGLSCLRFLVGSGFFKLVGAKGVQVGDMVSGGRRPSIVSGSDGQTLSRYCVRKGCARKKVASRFASNLVLRRNVAQNKLPVVYDNNVRS